MLKTTAAVLAALLLAACGSDDNSLGRSNGSSRVVAKCAPGGGTLTGSGSTFQKNIELQWIKDFTGACDGTTVDYKATGSGAGISQFAEGTVDYAGSDSLMKADEQANADKRCGRGNTAIHLPITAGAVVFIYNLRTLEKPLQLSAPTIAGMFTGAITRWDAPEVKADNPGVMLPPIAIQAVHRSDSSGTTDVLSNYLEAEGNGVWTLGTGKELSWPGGQAAKGSDGVTAAVKSTEGGITYAELSFAKSNDLPWAKVRNASGAYVDATGLAVSATLASAKLDTSKKDVRAEIDFSTAEPAAYPVAAVSYVIVCDKGNKNAPLLKAFLGYAAAGGQQTAEQLGYAPVPTGIAVKLGLAIEALT